MTNIVLTRHICTDMMQIDSKQLRAALRNWHQTGRLGTLPLASLRSVSRERQAQGYDDSAIGRGLALRQLLRQQIDALRPDHGAEDPADHRWRAYLILKEQYIDGRRPDWVASKLFLAKRSYFKAQARALAQLGYALADLERLNMPETQPAAARSEPFLAPPRINRPFIGRADLLDKIKARLAGGHNRLALIGLPGVGKTTILRELAHDAAIRKRFPAGILWAGLGKSPDLMSVLGSWARALGVPEATLGAAQTIGALAALVQARIGQGPFLLLIDDAWSGEDAVTFHLGGPDSAAVLTSRLGPVGHDFAGTDLLTVPSFNARESHQFLSATVAKRGVTDADLRRLAAQVGGLPLALSLAIRFLQHRADAIPDALAALNEVETRLSLTQPQSPLLRTGVPRSLRTAIAASIDILSAAANQPLATLALLPPKPNSLAREMVLALAPQAETVAELEAAGLIEAEGSDRLSLHQTVVDYVRATLDTPSAKGIVHYFVDLLEAPTERDDSVVPDVDNIVAAMHLAAAEKRSDPLCRGVLAFASFSQRKSYLPTAQLLLELALNHVDDGLAPAAVAALYVALANNHSRRGAYTAALEAISAAKAEDEGGENAGEIASALGTIQYRMGRLDEAKENLAAAGAYFKEMGLVDREAGMRGMLALIRLQMGDYAAAAADFQAIITACAARGETYYQARAWHNLGFANLQLRNYEVATTAYERCIELARADNDQLCALAALADLGSVAGQQGDILGARNRLLEALQASQSLGDQLSAAMILSNLGNISIDLGLFEEADNYLGQSLAISRPNGNLRCQGSGEIHYARLALLGGDLAEARAAAKRAITIAQQINDVQYEQEATILLGRALLAIDAAQAIPVFGRAAQLGREYGPASILAEALVGKAASLDLPTQADQAAKLLADVEALVMNGATLPRYLRLQRILLSQAIGHPLPAGELESLHADLMSSAAKIDDARLRQRYLEIVPENRAIVAAMAATPGPGT